MLGFELVEKLPYRPYAPVPCVLKTLTDALLSIRLRGDIKQALIGCGVLKNGGRLPF